MAEKLKDAGYKRIILGGVALDFLAEQLKPYVDSVVNTLHEDLKKRPGYFPPTCTHATYRDANTCATCKKLVDFLNGEYQGTQGVGRVWNNSVTDVKTWDANPWHLALLFMSMKENPATNTGPQDTDMSGLTSLMINCTRFKVDKLLVEKVRDWRNKLAHHAGSASLEEKHFIAIFSDAKALLNDPDVKGHIDKNVNVEAELKRIQQKNIQAGDIFRMLHRDLQQKLVTLRAMVCRRSLYQQEEVADSKTLAEEARLHLADGGNGEADDTILKKQLEEIDRLIQYLQLTCQVTKRYDKPDFEHVNAMPWAKSAAMEIDVSFENITMAKDSHSGPSFSDIEDLLPTDPTSGSRILLCGPPGSSKSTVTKRLARIWKDIKKAEGRLDEYSLLLVIPVFMLTQSVTDSLVKHLMLDDCSPQQLDSILRHHQHALLVLDGYDEGSTDQKQLVDQILSSDLLKNVTVLVTSREGFIEKLQVNSIYKSHGFSLSQKCEYVKKFFWKKDETVRDSVLKQLQNTASQIGELCDIPLNTCIICHMADEGVSLNVTTRTGLYDRMYEFISLRANDKYKKDGAADKPEEGSLTDIDHAFLLVQEVVYGHLLDNSYVLTDESIEKFISSQNASLLLKHLPQLGLVTKQSIIVRFKERPQFTLHHKTTAEFLAAKHVCQLDVGAKTEAVKKLLKKGPESQQILQFFCGLQSVERPKHLVHVMENIGKLLIATGGYNDSVERPEHLVHVMENIGKLQLAGGSNHGGGAGEEVGTRGVSIYSSSVNNPLTLLLLSELVGDVSLTDGTVRPLLAVWAPILESTLTEQQLTVALGYDPRQWGRSYSGEDTLQQAVLRAGRLEGVEALLGGYMSSVTTDHLLHALPRLTGMTRLLVSVHTAEQCRDLWRSARHLTALKHLFMHGRGDYQATAGPGDTHTTPGDAHVTPMDAALPPPLLYSVYLTHLPLLTAVQLAPLCDWVRGARELQWITTRRCRAPCGTLRQELGAALRQRGASMDKVGVDIFWQAGDGEEEDWEKLEQELRPYTGKLRVSRADS